MRELLGSFGSEEPSACDCEAAFDGDRLVVDAADCPGRGDLAESPDCRAAVVEALRERDATTVLVTTEGSERRYDGRGAALLLAAARFAERVAPRDARLAERAADDPLAAAEEAGGRAGPVADAAAETGLLAVADGLAADDAFRPLVGLAIARAGVVPAPPPGATLADVRDLETGATARVYDVPGEERRRYRLEPIGTTLSPAARAGLSRARELLAVGAVGDGDRAPLRAVRRASDDLDADAATMAAVLERHTRGYGVLEDLFADPDATDVFASAPAAENPLVVRVAGETMRTNVRLTADGAAALASRLRRASGRAFSRANPTLDAVAEDVGSTDRIRAAAVAEPLSDGPGFAFRAHGRDPWTLPALVANDTLSARAAGLLSVAVERGAAALLAGARGAGKTTLLSALLWELPAAERLVVMEDTPELPVRALQERARDVQGLRPDLDDGATSPGDALRTALRLGEGALVVGEVRGEEAQVLYEAMRVGANGGAVLGTVHGDGGRAVRERVVADLGVAPSAFGATDLVVTLEASPDGRRLASVEEVRTDGDGVSFVSLFDASDGWSGRLDRGDSRLLGSLARSGEGYGSTLDRVADRERFHADLAAADRTDPDAVTAAHAERRTAGGR